MRWRRRTPLRRTGSALLLLLASVAAKFLEEHQRTNSAELGNLAALGRPCNIQRIPASEFTQRQFREQFEGRKPFILTGAMEGWELLENSKWHDGTGRAPPPSSRRV